MTRAVALTLCALGCVQETYLGPDPLAPADAITTPADATTADAPTADTPTADTPARPEAPSLDAARDVGLETSTLCGNGRVDPDEDCATCPIDFATRPELPNDEDDNCNGRIDERTRVRLGRLHCANRMGCANPAGDWDHCFSTQPESRTCSFAPGSRFGAEHCLYDRTDLYVYPPTLATTREVTLRSGTLFRLWDCFSASSTRHVYVPGDDLRDTHLSWGYQCAPVGYVPLRAWPHSSTRQVYAHLIEAVSDVYYDFNAPPTVVEAGACTVRDEHALWWAWTD